MSSSNPLDVTPNLSHAAVQDARLEEVAPSLRHHQNELLTHIRWEFESHTPWIPGHRQQWPLVRTESFSFANKHFQFLMSWSE